MGLEHKRSADVDCLAESCQEIRYVVDFFSRWRPCLSRGQRAPCAPLLTLYRNMRGNIIAKPMLDGLHHFYELAA